MTALPGQPGTMEQAGDSRGGSSPPKAAARLRADAPIYEMPPRQEKSLKPVRTFAPRKEVLHALDAVPFTPSQGICTPTPTHAVMLVQQPVVYEYSQGWAPAAGLAASPRASSSSSARSESSSGYQGGAESPSSQPGTPYGRPLLFSSFYFPMPFSPRALQQAAQQGDSGSGGEPRTPPRIRAGPPEEEDGGLAAAGSLAFASPIGAGPQSPGQLVFAQYFADPFERFESGELPDSPPDGLSGGMGAGGSGGSDLDPTIELTPAARQIAEAMCAAQNLQGPPPSQLVELASLLQAYGLVNALSPPPPASASPEKQVRRTKSAPRTNPDGTVRLNARQRRTLRRAQERAMKALIDMQTQLLGIDGEQAAANMAAMAGMQPAVFGSPPHSASLASAPALPPAAPVQLQPINPLQAVYTLPPAPHMLAAAVPGWPVSAAMSTPMISQPLAPYQLEHSISMPLPMGPLGHGDHGPAAFLQHQHFQHGFDFIAPAPPMGHGGGGMYAAQHMAPYKAPTAVYSGSPATGGGAPLASRAYSAPQPYRSQGGGGGGGRLSRFAPGSGGSMSVPAH